MKACLLVVLLCVGACVNRPAFRREVEAANERLEDAFNRGDYRAVAAAYEDDALLLGPRGQRITGRAEIDAYWIRPWTNARWDLTVRGVEGTEEMPVQRGRSVLRYDRDGAPAVSDVEFILVWRLQADSSYRAAIDTWWKPAP